MGCAWCWKMPARCFPSEKPDEGGRCPPAEKKPAGIVGKAERFLELMTDEAKEDFCPERAGLLLPISRLRTRISRFPALSATMRSGGMTRAPLLKSGEENFARGRGVGVKNKGYCYLYNLFTFYL